MHPTQTFYLRPPANTQSNEGSSRAAILLLAVLVIVVSLWLFPMAWPWDATIDWHDAWQRIVSRPGNLVVPLVYTVIGVPVMVVNALRLRNARLTLNSKTLRYQSGVPFLNQWLDWSLDLEAIRSQELAFRVVATPGVAPSPRLYMVAWGAKKHSGDRSSPNLRPADWHLANQAIAKPKRQFLDFRLKSSALSAALLQAEFQALPLVQALAERGIALPPIATKPFNAGVDLLAFARMRTAVYLFFSLLLLALVLMLLVRHSYYVDAPPLTPWLLVAGAVSACMLAWLWGESANEEGGQTPKAGSAPVAGFRATQGIVSGLVGMAAGLCAPSVPLVYCDLVQAPQEAVFVVHQQPLQLVAASPAQDLPTIQPEIAKEYWQSLAKGSTVTLPMRQGPYGLWWQFDVTAVREKWLAYYDR